QPRPPTVTARVERRFSSLRGVGATRGMAPFTNTILAAILERTRGIMMLTESPRFRRTRTGLGPLAAAKSFQECWAELRTFSLTMRVCVTRWDQLLSARSLHLF